MKRDNASIRNSEAKVLNAYRFKVCMRASTMRTGAILAERMDKQT